MNINDIITELQKVLADLQAFVVPAADPVATVEVTTESGKTEEFVPEVEPTA